MSRKLALGTHPAYVSVQGRNRSLTQLCSSVALNLEKVTISQSGPSYNEAYLKELKASTPSSRPPPVSDPYDADMSMNVDEVSSVVLDDADSSFCKCYEYSIFSHLTNLHQLKQSSRLTRPSRPQRSGVSGSARQACPAKKTSFLCQ